MNRPTRVLGSLLLGGALWAVSAPAFAEYPDKPIRLIVPQAAGSATDTVARILAAELGPILGQTIVVEDKPGAAFTIGLDLVAKAAPDGYTLGVGPIGALAISPNMVAKLPYSIEREYAALLGARYLGLNVCETQLHELGNGKRTLGRGFRSRCRRLVWHYGPARKRG